MTSRRYVAIGCAVIAIMTDTYRLYAEVKLGLFAQGIIEAIPSYKNNKYYGALISATPPFNMLTMLCLPVMLLIKDKKKLESFNMAVCRIIYFPVCVFSAVYFTICNIILVPFAFFKALWHKMLLWRRSDDEIYRRNFFFFLLLGIPILLISIFTDLYWFTRHSNMWSIQRVSADSE